eukprot:m.173322 g.173322  ORF g.173322 m.173322 type:complete len:107 (+) comp18299_c1_seq3:1159-1479(+)
MQQPCLKSPAHVGLKQRLADLLSVGARASSRNMEALQVLKYAEGQYYYPHHDTITEQITMMSGPRMLTAFIYFNDVEEGDGFVAAPFCEPILRCVPLHWVEQDTNP